MGPSDLTIIILEHVTFKSPRAWDSEWEAAVFQILFFLLVANGQWHYQDRKCRAIPLGEYS